MMMDTEAVISPPSSPFHGFQSGVRAGADSPVEESPFHGFCNADIPQPIIIKTEPGEMRHYKNLFMTEKLTGVCVPAFQCIHNTFLRQK
jgi:hypothetical protein